MARSDGDRHGCLQKLTRNAVPLKLRSHEQVEEMFAIANGRNPSQILTG